MSRRPNTNYFGNDWSEAEKRMVWDKASTNLPLGPDQWRLDICGKLIKWSEHGNRHSDYGWEIDHITPVAKGGNDAIQNLQALHWRNNADKSDSIDWKCPR